MERTLIYTADNSIVSMPVSYFLKQKGFSSQNLVQLKKDPSAVLANGIPCFMNHILQPGDTLTLHIREDYSSEKIPPVNLPLNIVYEDADLMVINKPAGMPIHPSMNNYYNSLANALAYYFKQQNCPFVFRCINRLDRDTSGLTIVAKHYVSAGMLSAMIANKATSGITREYLAIAKGAVRPLEGTITAPLGRKEGSIIERTVDFENGESAVTHYKVLDEKNGHSLVSLILETGRTHQIRIHMKYLGYPLIGSKSAKEDLVRYAYGNTLLEGGIEKKNVIADSLRRVEKQIQTIQTVYRGIVDGKVKNCILQETDEGKKYICDVRNRLYKENLLRSVALLQTVTNSEDLKAIMHFFNVYAAEVNIGSDYMQDVLKCMMDEQVLRHLEKVELFEDWFSVIQSVFEGKSIDIQHLREEEVNLYWNIVDVLVEQATRMKISACDDDFQAVFYFKLQELYSQFANLEKTCSDKFAIIFYKRLLKKIEAVVIP